MGVNLELEKVLELLRQRQWRIAAKLLFEDTAVAESDELNFGRAVFYALQRDFRRAAAACSLISANSPLYKRALLVKLRCFVLAKCHLEALNLVSTAYSENNTDFQFLCRLGYWLLRAKEFDRARKIFRAATMLMPMSKLALNGFAEALERKRQWRQACFILEKLVHICQSDVTLRIRFARALIRNKRLVEAELVIRELPVSVDFEKAALEAELSYRAGRYLAAQTALEKLCIEFPARLEFFVWLGFSENALGNTNRMLEHLRAAQSRGSIEDCDALLPKEILKALLWLGDAHYLGNEWQQAIEDWEAASRVRVRFGLPYTNQSYFGYRLGECYFHTGRILDAASVTRDALKIAPTRAKPIHYRILAEACLTQQNFGEAVDILSEGTRLFPTDPLLCLAYAEALLAMGNTKSAAVAWGNASRLAPTLPALSPLKIRIEAALGEPIESGTYDTIRELPSIFVVPAEIYLARRSGSLLVGLQNTARALYALMLRRSMTQFGDTALGYIWALLQPMMLFAVLLIAFYTMGRRLPPGMTIELFLLAGIIPFRLFFHLHSSVSGSLHSHRSLFYFQNITPFVSFAATAILEFLTYTSAFYILFYAFYYFHHPVEVHSHLTVLFSLVGLATFGWSLGVISAVTALRYPFIDATTTAIKRGLFFISGVFFYANELPKTLRDILLVNPLFHLLEFIRGGLFVGYSPHYASITYVGAWLLAMILAALAADRLGRRLSIT